MTLEQLSQALWAVQGITGSHGRSRAVPSAGATYPLEVFVLVGKGSVTGLEDGIYHYQVETHCLKRHREGDLRNSLASAALGQRFLRQAPVSIVLCALYERTTAGYGRRGERYVHLEAGHAGQSFHLQAEALGLATVMVGAFDDDEVWRILEIEPSLKPIYIMPLGKALR